MGHQEIPGRKLKFLKAHRTTVFCTIACVNNNATDMSVTHVSQHACNDRQYLDKYTGATMCRVIILLCFETTASVILCILNLTLASFCTEYLTTSRCSSSHASRSTLVVD